MRGTLLLVASLLLPACAPRTARVMRADGDLAIAWSDAERAKPIAVRPLRADDRHSVMLVRLAGAEKPHIHADHDLVVVLLSGRVRMHLFGTTGTTSHGHVQPLGPGDVVEIPRGFAHWAENIDADASVAYVISTPPYDPADTVPVEPGR
ncbi:MAG TPA: cupin domain-containing protein [Planctomycetota bacterium]|nr:cupin domain-containing protein [Planctomycetota bacterium]